MFKNLKDHYFESIALREKIESRANFRAGITIALGSAIAFVVRSYNFSEAAITPRIITIIALAASLIGVIWASFWLACMLIDPVKYEYVPSQEKMLGYRDELTDLNEEVSREDAIKITKGDFEQNYAQATDHNFDLNKTKAKQVYRSGYGIVSAVGGILLAAILFGYQKANTGPSCLPLDQDQKTMPDSSIVRPEKPKNKRISQDEGPKKAEEVDSSSSSESSASSSKNN